MATYAITFRDTKTTHSIKADYYHINKGFVSLYSAHISGCTEEFAAYNCDNVLHIVEQNEYTTEEVLKQMKDYEEAKERME